jgi:hypothetical protein
MLHWLHLFGGATKHMPAGRKSSEEDEPRHKKHFQIDAGNGKGNTNFHVPRTK